MLGARPDVLDQLRRQVAAQQSGDPDDAEVLLRAALEEIHHLQIARDRRTVAGQATGILMERFDLAADQAFGVLARLSQETNRKLHVLAEELVAGRRTGRLPGAGGAVGAAPAG